jgi:Na+/H+ antiporter NhaD/arsenite permease-like protein
LVALLGAGLLIAVSGLPPSSYLVDIEWETLLFFAGLFIMVGALVKTGAIDVIARGLAAASGDSTDRALLLLWGSALLSAVVDNIAYVATMAPWSASWSRQGLTLA